MSSREVTRPDDESGSPLVDDIKAMDRLVAKEVAKAQASGRLTAMERGRRTRPNGVVEDYERLEFDAP